MTPRLNGFDKIAWLYDPLAGLVFGDRLRDAQATYLNHLKPGSRVLILGGGTGAILEALFKRQPSCKVTYIDASSLMLKRAQRRQLKGVAEYIHGDERSIPNLDFEAVITPFYLDMFTEPDLDRAIRQVGIRLAADAIWIAADFVQSQRLWHRTLLFVMYAFFRATTGIKAKSLPNWKRALERNGWLESEFQTNGFISSAIFRRREWVA